MDIGVPVIWILASGKDVDGCFLEDPDGSATRRWPNTRRASRAGDLNWRPGQPDGPDGEVAAHATLR